MGSLTDTEASLQTCLRSNIDIQAKIACELRSVAQKKAENRRMATRINQVLESTWDQLDVLTTPPPVPLPTPPSPTENRLSIVDEKLLQKRRFSQWQSRWQYDPYRKWNRRFFVDPVGSIPEPNRDTSKRRKLEENRFFHHNSPPWSRKELKQLTTIVDQLKTDNQAPSTDVTNIDFYRVANLLSSRTDSANDHGRQRSTLPSRNPLECRLCYLDSLPTKPFTKQDSLQIVEHVHMHDEPSWPDICQGRTGWQSLVTYQTKLVPPKTTSWTAAEDELLLKYAAAMGPQFVLDRAAAADMASRMLPHRTPKQILARANASLVNPNLVRDLWTDDEERRLLLCMRLYRDAPSSLVQSSNHFSNRASSSVSQKWNRSLSPEYSMRPFSKEEDKKLLEALNSSSDARWIHVASQFSSRHPQTLHKRWRELASQDDVVRRYRRSLKSQSKGRGGNAALSPDDFVIRVKYPGNEHGKYDTREQEHEDAADNKAIVTSVSL